jgi:hypothetical protein
VQQHGDHRERDADAAPLVDLVLVDARSSSTPDASPAACSSAVFPDSAPPAPTVAATAVRAAAPERAADHSSTWARNAST